MFVDCKTQDEVDHYWEKLSEGGHKDRCGWLTDKFGLSWQIVPAVLTEMLRDPDPAKAERVMKAMLQMDKLVIKDLKEAYERQ
jgi:predicted 3-demethylubiquinone-9 3-methyltransferase (glyoxalase superfamily)